MHVLWAPWRMTYVAGEKPRGCIFCPPAGGDWREALIVMETAGALVLLNRYPYTSGHVLVAPRRHVAAPAALTEEEFAALMRILREGIRIVTDEFKPDGVNVGLNLGRAAGAGVEEHMHWHVVPRWAGDTNFMPVCAAVRVLPEHLEATYERLRPGFAALEKQGA